LPEIFLKKKLSSKLYHDYVHEVEVMYVFASVKV